MRVNKVPLADTHAFSPFFLDFIEKKEKLAPFYNRYPEVTSFQDQIKEKKSSFPQLNRNRLADSLAKQYAGLTLSPSVEKNIARLKESKTFTVTTGHQLNICTGPLYFIFKIVTVINTCKQLKKQYPEYDFVPVYWMASEDHDYEEIKYFKLYGKKYVWNTEQSGAVGRFNTSGLDKLLSEVPGETEIFREAYTKNQQLSAAVRHYVNSLFGSEGVIVLDADYHELKELFTNVIREDVLESANKTIVDKTNQELEKRGYKVQVFCRDINFFYLAEGIRSRIEKEGDRFKVLDTELSFSTKEIQNLIDQEPEKFSPNVILRPLYQECILPNLAYVGGPAEIVYWLQLKDVFKHAQIPFPILVPRNFGMVIDHETARKFAKTGLELSDLFEEKNYLFNHWVLKNSPRNLTVGNERTEVDKIFDALKERAQSIDSTLTPLVGAEGKRALNSLEKIERKLLRAEKRLHADKLRQIEAVKDNLFPNGGLQERSENFLNFSQRDPEFISRLLSSFDPFDFQFHVLSYTT